MCGIAGIVTRSGSAPSGSRLEKMKQALTQRGPDDSGILIDEGMGLAHTRLSVIDLSPSSKCPMTGGSGRFSLVYNGEIYNYRELRDELIRLGRQFATQGDTETLLAGYEVWGPSVCEKLDGMFSFAIWDRQKRELTLARDRLGEKPLYYLLSGSEFIFASTISALLEGANTLPAVNFDALTCLLSHQFIPKNHCIFKGIRSLPAAHFMKVSRAGAGSPKRYWDVPMEEVPCAIEEAVERIEPRLIEAVKSRMVADVDVGGFLSGGIDSSLLLTIMAQNSRRKIRTYSVGLKDDSHSELPFARLVARRIGSEHEEVSFCQRDVVRILPELVWQFGEPFCDPAALPIYFLSKSAAKSVKVCVGGDGGDELFGGYSRIQRHLMAESFRRLKPVLLWRRFLPQVLDAMCRSGAVGGLCSKYRNMKKLALDGYPDGYANDYTWLNYLRKLFPPEMSEKFDESHRPERCYNQPMHFLPAKEGGKRYLYNELKVLLPDDYLIKIDIASMASSLEMRSPFLAHRLVEAAWEIPRRHHITEFKTKILLKRLAAKYIPSQIAERKKAGLSIPLDLWFREDLGALLRHLWKDSVLLRMKWINKEIPESFMASHFRGEENHGVRLWIILWLELWSRIFLEKSMSRGDSLEGCSG